MYILKILKYILINIFLTCLVACNPPVTFNEPQPTNTNNLKKFPKRLFGQYLNISDNSTLLLNDKFIIRNYEFEYKVHLNQLDSNVQLIGDSLININTKEITIIKREGDSIISHTSYTDTLFHIDNDNIVRKYKGYYFLNKRYDELGWEVKKIELSKGKLILSSIASKIEIENLKEITETPVDTVSTYKLSHSKKEFRKFINNGGFNESEIFIKLK